MKSKTPDFQAFWSLFRERAMRLARAGSADDTVYDELLGKLQEIEPGLFLEFSASQPECELIVTADGDRELFPVARAAVAQAPRIDGWTIQALKPGLGMPATAAWEGITVAINAWSLNHSKRAIPIWDCAYSCQDSRPLILKRLTMHC